MPRMVPPAPAPMYRRNNNMLRPVNQPIVAIPKTVLPEGWNAPLENPMPRMVPPLPALAHEAPLPNWMPIMLPPPLASEQALAALEGQQRLRHIAIAEEQQRQQEHALAVLEQQQRLRYIAIAEEQERQQEQQGQQQALATLHQERRQEFRLE
ncbi:hypothetical protein C0995_003954, partial [Termitomyces sp. Mi166